MRLMSTLIVSAAIGAAAAVLIPQSTREVAAAGPAGTASQAARGKYLVNIMVCHDCHTPWKMGPQGPEPDMTRALSGHPEDLVMPPPPALNDETWAWAGAATNTAFAGPWGVSFAANLTPDPETGIGKWNESTFIEALRSGRHEGIGRPILPPMPYPWFRQATDEDLKAIFAHLRMLPPIRNRVPQPIDPPEEK